MISSNMGPPLPRVAAVCSGISQHIQAVMRMSLLICSGCTNWLYGIYAALWELDFTELPFTIVQVSDTCWNLWLMQKILNAFQTQSVGRKKSTNAKKYDHIWQTVNCDWFIFCGATWPIWAAIEGNSPCNQSYVYLFLLSQVGKTFRSHSTGWERDDLVTKPRLPAELVTLPQYIQYLTQRLISAGSLGIFLLRVAKSCPVNPLTASVICCAQWCKIDLHYSHSVMRNGQFLT